MSTINSQHKPKGNKENQYFDSKCNYTILQKKKKNPLQLCCKAVAASLKKTVSKKCSKGKSTMSSWLCHMACSADQPYLALPSAKISCLLFKWSLQHWHIQLHMTVVLAMLHRRKHCWTAPYPGLNEAGAVSRVVDVQLFFKKTRVHRCGTMHCRLKYWF